MDKDKREIIMHYMDMAGFVTVDRDPGYKTTMNGLFETGFALCVYDDLGILDKHDADAFYETVRSCQDEKTPGVYDRFPAIDGHARVEDPDSRDDTAGVVAGSLVCNFEFQKDVFDHLVWADNTDGAQAGWWALRIRFLSDTMWYCLANKKFRLLSPILMATLALKLIRPSVDYNVLIDYMKVHTLAKDNKAWTWFKKRFTKRARLVQSAVAYFKGSHPIANLVVKVADK